MHSKQMDRLHRGLENPEKILLQIGLNTGMTFVDIGCGYGFFSIPAAEIVGPSGKVICIDINSKAVDVLTTLTKKRGLKNVETIVGKAEDIVPCAECGDIAFFGTVLHDFENPKQVLSNANKILKLNGLLVDLDWKKERGIMGPPYSIRFDKNFAAQMITEQGFEIVSIKDLSRFYYIIKAILKKNNK